MAILVTNDDGYGEGLEILLSVARKIDPDSYAIIPNRQRSAVGMSLTLHKPLRLHKRSENIFELNGTPADCVLFGLYSDEFKKPELVLSGLNSGDNSSLEAILGSGTIGACWEAVISGISGIAFSMVKQKEEDRGSHQKIGHREKFEKVILEAISSIKSNQAKDTIYSVNIPADPSNSKIVYCEKLQRRRFTAIIDKRRDPSGRPYYWITGDFNVVEPGTDLHELVKNNNITITPIPVFLGRQ